MSTFSAHSFDHDDMFTRWHRVCKQSAEALQLLRFACASVFRHVNVLTARAPGSASHHGIRALTVFATCTHMQAEMSRLWWLGQQGKPCPREYPFLHLQTSTTLSPAGMRSQRPCELFQSCLTRSCAHFPDPCEVYMPQK